jgi:hypothetical protein
VLAGVLDGGVHEAGKALAQTWCANCHMVTPGQATATSDSVPTFMAIAARPNVTGDGLRALYDALLGAGAVPRYVGMRLGRVRTTDGEPLAVEVTTLLVSSQ